MAITERDAEVLVQRLTARANMANEVFLRAIGKRLDEIGKLSPTNAHQLVQMLKYNGSYEDIVKKMMKYTNKNISEIDKIFEEYAKKDQEFFKQFYEYRNVPYEKYANNSFIKTQTEALSNLVKTEMYNFTRDNVLGYNFIDPITKVNEFHNLRNTYNTLLDMALMNVSQGKQNYDEAFKNIIKGIGGSGLRTLQYESGRSIRLDSAINMHLNSRFNELQEKNQEVYGRDFGADGWEISVHEYPAPDHEEVQGRQFSKEAYSDLQRYGMATDYRGVQIDLHMVLKNNESASGFRPIGELNCKHYPLPIILGVSQPLYTEMALKHIKDRNDEGFDFEGKHYSLYEGTQLQRSIEREIRKQKDTQIFAVASKNKEVIAETQTKITQLTHKYNELCKVSGLPTQAQRMKVVGYKRVNVNKIKDTVRKETDIYPPEEEKKSSSVALETSKIDENERFMYLSQELEHNNIRVDNSFYNLKDEKLRNNNLEHLLEISNKYPHGIYAKKPLLVKAIKRKKELNYGRATYTEHSIEFNERWFNDGKAFLETQKNDIKTKWHYEVPEDKINLYTLTHEYGHQVEYDYLRGRRVASVTAGRRFDFRKADLELRDTLISDAMNKAGTKMNITQFKDKYFSRYAKSTRNYEWFAELFAKMELGEQDEFTEALRDWLVKYYGL